MRSCFFPIVKKYFQDQLKILDKFFVYVCHNVLINQLLSKLSTNLHAKLHHILLRRKYTKRVPASNSSPAKKGIETMVFQCHFSVLVTDFEQVKAHWGTTSVHSVHNHSLFFQKCGWCFITVGWLHLHALYMWHYINISASPNTKISTF